MQALTCLEILELVAKGDLSPADVTAGTPDKKKPKAEGVILKANDEKRIAYGWASIVEKGGKPVIDAHGDVIHPDELSRAAQAFVKSDRAAKVMHAGKQVGEIVESIVFTKDIQDALGIDLGLVGWFIGMHVPDEATWKAVKDGVYKAFSIGGKGKRVEL